MSRDHYVSYNHLSRFAVPDNLRVPRFLKRNGNQANVNPEGFCFENDWDTAIDIDGVRKGVRWNEIEPAFFKVLHHVDKHGFLPTDNESRNAVAHFMAAQLCRQPLARDRVRHAIGGRTRYPGYLPIRYDVTVPRKGNPPVNDSEIKRIHLAIIQMQCQDIARYIYERGYFLIRAYDEEFLITDNPCLAIPASPGDLINADPESGLIYADNEESDDLPFAYSTTDDHLRFVMPIGPRLAIATGYELTEDLIQALAVAAGNSMLRVADRSYSLGDLENIKAFRMMMGLSEYFGRGQIHEWNTFQLILSTDVVACRNSRTLDSYRHIHEMMGQTSKERFKSTNRSTMREFGLVMKYSAGMAGYAINSPYAARCTLARDARPYPELFLPDRRDTSNLHASLRCAGRRCKRNPYDYKDEELRHRRRLRSIPQIETPLYFTAAEPPPPKNKRQKAGFKRQQTRIMVGSQLSGINPIS